MLPLSSLFFVLLCCFYYGGQPLNVEKRKVEGEKRRKCGNENLRERKLNGYGEAENVMEESGMLMEGFGVWVCQDNVGGSRGRILWHGKGFRQVPKCDARETLRIRSIPPNIRFCCRSSDCRGQRKLRILPCLQPRPGAEEAVD